MDAVARADRRGDPLQHLTLTTAADQVVTGEVVGAQGSEVRVRLVGGSTVAVDGQAVRPLRIVTDDEPRRR